MKLRQASLFPRQRRTLAAALRDRVMGALKDERRCYQQLCKQLGRNPSRKPVHTCRTTGRKILALLTLLEAVTAAGEIAKSRRAVKHDLKRLAPLRDTQVQLRGEEKLRTRHPQLKWFFRKLRHEEKRLERSVRRHFKRSHAAKHLQLTAKVLEVASANCLFQPAWRGAAIAAVKAASDRAFRRQPKVAAGLALHQGRVALRDLRYLAELLAPEFSRSLRKPLEKLHAVQSVMGDVHDLELMTASAVRAAKGRNYRQRSLKTFFSELARRRAALTRDYRIIAPKIFLRPGGGVASLRRQFTASRLNN